MNSYNNLYPLIYDWNNLHKAYLKARKGKRNKAAAANYEISLEENLIILQNELIYKMFEVGKYRTFKVYDPKERTIQALSFKYRVCQHAILNIIEPLFEATFFRDSYACRVDKGTIASINRLQDYFKHFTKNDYYLFCDIRKFFDSMDHDVMKRLLRRKISCKDTLWILDLYIDSTPGYKGFPIGNLLSQLFANIYMNEVDTFIKHKLHAKYYDRYMDDFGMLHKNKEVLKIWLASIKVFLHNELKLELNEKTQINKIKFGISFLGYRNFKYHRVMKKKNWQKNKRKFKNMALRVKSGEIPLDKLKRSYYSFKGYLKWCNGHKKLTKINQIIKNQLKP